MSFSFVHKKIKTKERKIQIWITIAKAILNRSQYKIKKNHSHGNYANMCSFNGNTHLRESASYFLYIEIVQESVVFNPRYGHGNKSTTSWRVKFVRCWLLFLGGYIMMLCADRSDQLAPQFTHPLYVIAFTHMYIGFKGISLGICVVTMWIFVFMFWLITANAEHGTVVWSHSYNMSRK